jgi:hypothetical protein
MSLSPTGKQLQARLWSLFPAGSCPPGLPAGAPLGSLTDEGASFRPAFGDAGANGSETGLCNHQDAERFRKEFARMLNKKPPAVEIRDLDGNNMRFAVSVDGLIRFVGSREECERRAKILRPSTDDRERQDWMLGHVVR